MLSLLADGDTYKVITNNPIKKLDNGINMFLKKCHNEELVDERVYNKLRPKQSNMARLYGLIKTHKGTAPNHPYRPVVSTINYSNAKLSRYIADILKNITTNDEFKVSNSRAAKDILRDVIVPKDHGLVSFDIQSLFTSVPLDLFMRCVDEYWDDISVHTTFGQSRFKEALGFCLHHNYFTFNGVIYLQLKGLPMGGSLSPIAAEIVIRKFYYSIVKPLNLLVYLQYVDDSISIVPLNQINTILDKFNRFHPDLNFTFEIEVDSKISFLDLLIIKNPCGSLSFDLYVKPTDSGRFINYFSQCPFIYKINTLYYFLRRIHSLCDESYSVRNIDAFRRAALSNSYPLHVINSVIRNFNQKRNARLAAPATPAPISNDSPFFSLFYVPGLSEKIQKIFKLHNVRTALSSRGSISFLYNNKDVVPPHEQHNVIYLIRCLDCPNPTKVYVGQTSRMFSLRKREHELSIKNIKLSTALSSHAIEFMHGFDFDNAVILMKVDNTYKRLVAEKCMIKTYAQRALNYQTDCIGLSNVYLSILNNVNAQI